MLYTARGTDKETALLIGGNTSIFEEVPPGSGAKIHLHPGECALVVNNAEEELSLYAAEGEFSVDLLGNVANDEVLLLPAGQSMLFARYTVEGKGFVFFTQPLADLIGSEA